MTDTHAHLYLPEFRDRWPQLLQRAATAGVGPILLPAIDHETHEAVLELEAAHPQCRAMMGLHPCSVGANYQEELLLVRNYFAQRSFVAVGEIGLDFYWDKTFTEQQYTAFHDQIGIALEYGVPIAVHSRNATAEAIEVVRQYPLLRGVFHCFGGTQAEAETLMELGFYLGIGGVVTFKNSGLDKIVAAVGLDRVVLETDAPYLAPVPFRGKRNEPSYTRYVAEKVAEITGRTLAEVADITSRNATQLFGPL
ncbi:MAG: TatD family deoxyribonuclease [Sphingobacteriales bacterium]|nr:MAG: TatD family deoxyribonuclease [Sphingobacteriales bacterium]